MTLSKERTLFDLIKDMELHDAPTQTTRHGKHYEFTIAIGKDEVAHVTLTEEALEELKERMIDDARGI